MKKVLTAALVAVTVAGAAISASTPAEARWRGGAVAAGVIGGIAAGALIAGAARPAYGYYGYAPAPVYAPPPAYYGPPAYAYGPACWWQKQRFWDGYGWRIRRVQVCR